MIKGEQIMPKLTPEDLKSLKTEAKNKLKSISESSGKLRPADMLLIQVKLSQAQQEIDLLTTTINLLPLFNVKNYCLKMSIVRGLDYYKGIVFEIDAPNLGAEKQLCGGGAYELIPLFGGRETPTAGFAIGFDRTLLALETEKYAFPSSTLTTYVIPVNEAAIEQSFTIVQQLRSKNIATDIDLLRRGIRKALKYASSINAKTAIIVGPQELKQDAVMLRDMKSGKQELVKLSTLPKKFQ